MIKKVAFVIIKLSLYLSGVAQEGFFSKSYDYDGGYEIPKAVVETDSGYIIFGSGTDFQTMLGWRGRKVIFVNKNGDETSRKITGKTGQQLYNGAVDNFIQLSDSSYATVYTASDSGIQDYYVLFVKYDKQVDTVFTKEYRTNSYDLGNILIETTDNKIAIIGSQFDNWDFPNEGKFQVLLIDTNGSIIWQKVYNLPTKGRGFGITNAHDGGYVMCGWGFTGGKDIDTYIIKIDTAGNVEWTKNYGTVNFDGGGGAIQQTADNCYILMGRIDTFNLQSNSGQELFSSYVMKVDINGNMLWRYITNYGNWYHQIDMVREVASGKGYIAVGQIYEEQLNGENIVGLLLRFDNDGNLLWERRYALINNLPTTVNGFAAYSELHNVINTIDKGFICMGQTYNLTPDFWLLKLDSLGCMGDYCGLTDPDCYYRPYPNCDDTLSVADISHEQKDQRVMVYPNPANDIIYFKPFSKYATIKSITLYDVTGKAQNSPPFQGGVGGGFYNTQTLNISILSQGIYYYEVYLDDILMPQENSKPVRGKIVKQ